MRSLSILALAALVASCAGPGARVSVPASGEDGSALPAARELNGTWRGNYSQLGMALYLDDADCTLSITEAATFTAKCTRSAVGTNNLAKSSSWSGRVVTKANEVMLQDKDGLWPDITLKRSGDHLYGTTLDPRVGATVQMNFEHVRNTAAAGGGEPGSS